MKVYIVKRVGNYPIESIWATEDLAKAAVEELVQKVKKSYHRFCIDAEQWARDQYIWTGYDVCTE